MSRSYFIKIYLLSPGKQSCPSSFVWPKCEWQKIFFCKQRRAQLSCWTQVFVLFLLISQQFLLGWLSFSDLPDYQALVAKVILSSLIYPSFPIVIERVVSIKSHGILCIEATKQCCDITEAHWWVPLMESQETRMSYWCPLEAIRMKR